MAGRLTTLTLCACVAYCLTRLGCAFVTSPTSPSLRSRTARAAQNSESESSYLYQPVAWALDFGVPQDETEQVLQLCDMSTVWPAGVGSIDRDGFRDRLKARGAKSEKAIDTVFNAFAGGTWLVTNRDQVEEILEKCRPGGRADAKPLGFVLSARLQIIGAWLFLNVFSSFAGYFVIGRPILASQFGIDLLPNLPRWWE
mmetsp:Transcript_21262/g.40016  ORF Transcript_21262/g.40016 Transcript_21262/m.40016 type:complete len:199 (-) Transcript_21262:51-647(-)